MDKIKFQQEWLNKSIDRAIKSKDPQYLQDVKSHYGRLYYELNLMFQEKRMMKRYDDTVGRV
ncbi:hypothetical protein HMPREF2626_01445 [Aerococcus sp. HMSC062A02]|nr:hypothetical protein HMPREF2626_01445 [Aerococcus sp. HMSC062A02]